MAKQRPRKLRPRTFTDDDVVNDVVAVLNGPFSTWAKTSLAQGALWAWSARHGKYEGCPYWSRNALDQFRATGSISGLRHEHIVPRKLTVAKIMGVSSITREDLRAILETHALGCVVTKAEAQILDRGLKQRMPEGFATAGHPNFENVWARYIEKKIDRIGPVCWKGSEVVLPAV